MRAVTVTSPQGFDSIELTDLPVPQPGPGQLRVRVRASAVHPADLAAANGAFAHLTPPGERRVLGWDLAGTVDAVGSGVDRFRPGDEVVGLTFWLAAGEGVQAEFALLDASAAAPAPAGVDPASAATLPLNALTAAYALDLADLPPGATLAVFGAAGAVGGFAVQLAAARGLRVVAVAAAHDEHLVRDYGATWFADRSAEPASAIRALVDGGVDGVYDPALAGAEALSAVRDGGVYVNGYPVAPESQRGIRTEGVQVAPDGVRLAELAGLVEAGRLRLRLAETYPLADAASAYKRLAAGGVRGGIVLVP
ncbi:NADP-dependent oxidoreductase [Hamadaea sp. NPDC050747]|uniref:NADP-dependent oxidoreductase n=1 Tax=Hamadaea sp. NPDC050747 TaxID=3155789 RepID=UPI0033CC8F63